MYIVIKILNKGERIMTRDDLKEGMIIEERDGGRYVVKSGAVYFLDKGLLYGYLNDYAEDLTDGNGGSWGDIVRVYDKNDNLLWDRYVEERKIAEMIVEHRGNPVQFIKDYLGIELTWYQEMMLKKILNESEE